MSEYDDPITKRLKGYITKFDTGRNTGIIAGPGKINYAFSSADFLEKIPDLMKIPGVSFEILNGRAIRIRPDDTLPRPSEKPRSGYAVLGAAKCPDCDWRLPILGQSSTPKFRRIHHGRCPKCTSSIKLLSAFKGYHHIVVSGIIFVPATARFFLNRSRQFLDDQTFSILALASLLFYFVQIFLFFFVYFQEKFVKMKDVEVFE